MESQFAGYGFQGSRTFAEPGVPPHYAPDRGFVLSRLDLALDIDPEAQTLSGEARVAVRPLPSGLGDVVLDLDELSVEAVRGEDGRALPWRLDDGKLTVRGVSEAGEAVLVRFSGSPRRGLYFTGPTPAEPKRARMAWTQCQDEDAHYVFPCVDHPSVKSPVGLTVRAPDGYTVVSNGRFMGENGGVWRWEQSEPIPAYLITVVVARLTCVSASWRDRSVRYLAPEGTETAVLERVFGRTPAMLERFSQLFGVDYAWPRYDQVVVHDFIFGGMENVAATTLTDMVLTDDRAALDHDSDDLIAHELAHQWFGDLVTCQDWSQAWLNEGWATYSEHLWKLADAGQEEADYALFCHLEAYLKEDGSRYRRAIVDYRFREPIDLFDRHLYEKGALVLHTLRAELGDRPFWTGVRAYLTRHAYGTVHTRDFQRALEEASGRNLDRFFHQWIYGAGHPALEVAVEHADGLLTVTVKQTQSGENVADAFAFPLKLAVVTGDRRAELTLHVKERERTWAIPTAEAPDRVEVDAGFRVLSELTLKASRGLLCAALSGDPSAVGRIRAARALADEGSPAALKALAAALRDEPFWAVRAEIAGALGRRGGEIARLALLGALVDAHPKARVAVVAALGNVPHPHVEDALARIALQGDPSIQVEGEAARALGRCRSPRALEVCTALLERESWGELLRARALEGLGASRDPDALPVLLAWTDEDRPARARGAAVGALGRMADEVPAARADAVDRLVRLAPDAPFRVAMATISALGAARDPRGAAVLRQLHDSGGDGRLMRAAYEALQRIAEGRTGDDALAALRRDVEGLHEENRALRDRLGLIEGQLPAKPDAAR